MMGKVDKCVLQQVTHYVKLGVAYVKKAFISPNTWPLIYFIQLVDCEFGSSSQISGGGLRGRNRMVVGFTHTYAISNYHTNIGSFESHSG